MSTPHGQLTVLRVDAQGVVHALLDGGGVLPHARPGMTCHDVVCARSRDGGKVCVARCVERLDDVGQASRHVVLPDDRIAELTCSRVGDETLVVVRATGRSASAFPRRLTAREREVLELLAVGLTNGEIGETLGLRPATVRTHVEHLLDKLGAVTRAEAVSAAKDLGELT